MSRLPKEITTTLLLAILKREEMTMTQLQQETGFSTITVLNHVEELMTANLLEEKREKELPRRRYLRLSQEGKRVAMTLNLLTKSILDPMLLVDLGAKAGRMAAYRETAALLRQPNTTRDSATAEILVRDLEMLIETIAIIANALPPELLNYIELLNSILRKLKEKAATGNEYLQKKDIRRSAETVATAWKEYGEYYGGLKQLANEVKERKLDGLLKIIEFVTPERG